MSQLETPAEKLRREIEMEYQQTEHWRKNQDFWAANESHWRWVYALGFLAVVLNALKPLWSK